MEKKPKKKTKERQKNQPHFVIVLTANKSVKQKKERKTIIVQKTEAHKFISKNKKTSGNKK